MASISERIPRYPPSACPSLSRSMKFFDHVRMIDVDPSGWVVTRVVAEVDGVDPRVLGPGWSPTILMMGFGSQRKGVEVRTEPVSSIPGMVEISLSKPRDRMVEVQSMMRLCSVVGANSMCSAARLIKRSAVPHTLSPLGVEWL